MRAVLVAVVIASSAGMAAAERCGPNNCAEGTVCCNEGCGICVEPRGACILPFCQWGRPATFTPEETPSVDVYSHVTALASTAESARARVQLYLGGGFALRARLTGDEDRATYGVGATLLLPRLGHFITWAATVDGDVGRDVGTLGAGLAFADHSIVGTHVHLRGLVTRDGEALFDGGVGVSNDLRWIANYLHGPRLPIGLRANYRLLQGDERTHELSGGVYLLASDELRLGVEILATFAAEDSVAGLLRIDYYWEANF